MTLDSPLRRDWVELTGLSQPASSPTFSLLTQNVLADRYTYAQLYSWVPHPGIYLNATFRSRKLAQTLRLYGSDLVCLQELQQDQLEFLLDSEGLSDTYDSHYKQITRRRPWEPPADLDLSSSGEDEETYQKRKEGVGVLWNKEIFELVRAVDIEFNREAHEEAMSVLGDGAVTHAEMKRNTFYKRVCLSSHNVAVIVVLRRREDGKRLVLSTIHGYFRKSNWMEQVYQYEILLKRVTEVAKSEGVRAIVICGDFNMKRSSPTLQFVEKGNVNEYLDEVEEEYVEEGEGPGKRLRSIWYDLLKRRPDHSLKLRRAYSVEMKPFTHYSKREHVFDCLDYVFHSVGPLVPREVLKVEPVDGTEEEQFPNKSNYSDHLMLGVTFEFAEGFEESEADN